MPLSVQDLLLIASSPLALHKGADYCRQERVVYAMSPDGNVRAAVRGSGGMAYNVLLRFGGGLNSLEEYSCDCPAMENYEGACKHVIATVLTVQSGGSGRFPGGVRRMRSASVLESDRLLERSARRTAERAALCRDGAAALETILEIAENGRSRLSFRVGEERMYVLRDIGKFVSLVNNCETAGYGKKYSLLHTPASFTPASRKMLRFIMRNYELNLTASANGGRYGFSSYHYGDDKRHFFLTPHMMDEFFDIMEGKKFPVLRADGHEMTTLALREDFKAELRLEASDGAFILRSDKFHATRGVNGFYVLHSGVLYCCSADYADRCGDLLSTLAKNKCSLEFDGDTLTALYSTVLAEAGQYISLHAEENILAHRPPPLETKIYLDSPEANSVSAIMTFTYGANTHNAFSRKDLSRSFDLAGEIMAENMLAEYFAGVSGADGTMLIHDDTDAIYRLVSRGLAELSGFAELYASDSFGRIRVHPPVRVNVGVRADSGLLEIDFGVEGVDWAELGEILASYRLAKKYHKLRDGSFLALEDGAVSRLSEIADGLDLDMNRLEDGHAELPLSRALYIDEALKRGEGLRYDRDAAFKGLIRGIKDAADADYAIPPELKKILRNYQEAGYRWMRTLEAYGFGGILADDMGLGKTVQVLALIKSAIDEKRHDLPSIVICPASLTLNWESESKKFTSDIKALAISGAAAERADAISRAGEYDLIITSYDQLKRDIRLYESLRFTYVIIDEAQYIKNHSTQNAKAVKLLRGRTKLALTGTPVENSLAELWSIYDFLMPGYLFAYSRFRKKYEEPIAKQGDARAAERLRQLVRPFLLRRLKKDVLSELPPKTETVLRSAMEDEQRQIYLATLAQAKKTAEQAASMPGGGGVAVLAALTRLRQICCDPSLVYENYNGGSVKLESCLELVESCVESGHRMLLFSQFTSMLDIIQSRLSGMSISFCRLDGSTKPGDRLAMAERFNAGGTDVFLISLKAGGTGLNLTGADVVIHYDPWWNISAQNQAADRAHRIGQKNSVQVYKLIVKDSIEERILKMQENKAMLAGEIVREGGNAFEGMSREDLLELFAE